MVGRFMERREIHLDYSFARSYTGHTVVSGLIKLSADTLRGGTRKLNDINYYSVVLCLRIYTSFIFRINRKITAFNTLLDLEYLKSL